MRILWIDIDNFKCFRRIRVPSAGILPEGLVFVDGENSSGKSSLFDAIFYALFYDPSKAKMIGTKDDLIRRSASKTVVEVGFELSGRYYEVRREHEKGKAVQAYLWKINKDKALEGISEGRQELAKTITDVDAKITSLLNITRDNALNTTFVRQGEVQRLAESTGRDLRETIYELFQLDSYKDRLNDIIKLKISKLDDKLGKYAIERSDENIDEEVEELNNQIKEMKEKIKLFDQKIAEHEEKLKLYPNLKDLQQIIDWSTKLKQRDESLTRRYEVLNTESKKYKLSPPLTDKLFNKKLKEIDEETQTTLTELAKIEAEIEVLRNERSDLFQSLQDENHKKSSVEKMLAGEGKKIICELCSQELSETSVDEIKTRVDRNIPILEKGLVRKDEKIGAIGKTVEKLENKEKENQALKINIQNLQTNFLDYSSLKQEREKWKEDQLVLLKKYDAQTLQELASKYNLKEFNELFEKIQEIQLSKQKEELDKKSNLNQISEKNTKIKSLDEEKKKNLKKKEKQSEINYQKDLIKNVEKHVEGFITEDLITNKLIAGIQQSTNNYIYLFTKGRYSEIYLEPTRQRTLKMSIKDGIAGFIKNQNQLSGGDSTAIGLGLRLGISDLLKRVRPLKDSPYQPPLMDLLILDEPLGSLDSGRRQKVIEGLLSEKKFPQIFLITHTSIRSEVSAPTISIHSSAKGSTATFYPAPTDIEKEATEMDLSEIEVTP